MGYTHYFSLSRKPGTVRWSAFIAEVERVFAHPAVAGTIAEGSNLSSPPVANKKEVRFNGKGELRHETFLLLNTKHHLWCKTGGPRQMDYCTAWGKDYDLAVCVVLILASHHFTEVVTSDGDWDEEGWQRARALYTRVTRRIARCPWETKQCRQCARAFAAKGHSWGAGKRACPECGCGSSMSSGKSLNRCMDCAERLHPRGSNPFLSRSEHQLKSVPEVVETGDKSLCYYCSVGVKTPAEAGARVAAQMERMLVELAKMTKKRGRKLSLVSPQEI